ncbi:cupin domain-containing protein [Polynucleobacter sp. UB-Piko-W3]|uniref:cupin domain-containing protein n=1 Tax=Polynucleobacter sp. UB-Piko-W3 TaxID=1819735 RepID=UPI001C0BD6BA|nr:cupin [Polynucleobacter sp. UB-Piko-W3]MBU3554295.1 cupin [Polynucleobacter sp. UB-Piko-W3]
MNQAQFIEMLQQEDYPDPVEVRQAPNGSLGEHSHPFAVKALVIDGSINITIQGNRKTYSIGDVFQLGFEEPHSESYGPTGVVYLASRNH